MDEQKAYLDRIFSSRHLDWTARYYLLGDIFNDLKKEAIRDQQRGHQLMAVTSAITQYYLEQYDLEHAIEPWRRLDNSRDPVLKFILALYRAPRSFATGLITMAFLTLLPYLFPALPSWAGRLMTIPAFTLLVVFIVFIIASLVAVTIRFLSHQGMSYIELLMPRLLGAIIVGLSILAFEGTVWDISLQLQWPNWIVLCLTTYIASISYMFIDVHKTIRLTSAPERAGNIVVQHEAQGYQTSRSLQITWRLFSIGLFEAFLASLFVSSILSLAIKSDLMQNDGRMFCCGNLFCVTEPGMYGFAVYLGGKAALVYLPKLVLLWTGLSLLIGAFAQLLWQERKITSY